MYSVIKKTKRKNKQKLKENHEISKKYGGCLLKYDRLTDRQTK